MKNRMPIKDRILQYLYETDGYVSGEELSKQLSISRTAIWKHIQELKKEGYQIDSITRRGHCLQTTPDLLTAKEVQRNLNTSVFGKSYHYYDTIDSTNATAKILAESGAEEGTVVIAEEQVCGKGRMSRIWLSPERQGIYMSIIVRPQIPTTQAAQLTLVTATVVADYLRKRFQIPAEIKWPNDILVNSKKICGILIEMSSDLDRIHYAVIGIGINVNSTFEGVVGNQESQYWPTSVFQETGTTVDRVEFLSKLLEDLEKAYTSYIELGFQMFKEKWEMYAYSIGKQVTIVTPTENLTGLLQGIDNTGALTLVVDGVQRTIYSGEFLL